MKKKKDKSFEDYYCPDEELDKLFFCSRRRKEITIRQCIIDYLNANAYEKKRLRCFHCKLGKENRKKYSNS